MIVVVLFTYIVFQFICTFIKRDWLFSWNMFIGVQKCEFSVVDQFGIYVNIWDYIPHSNINMTKSELQLFVFYLSCVHQVRLTGQITIIDNFDTITVNIINGEFD